MGRGGDDEERVEAEEHEIVMGARQNGARREARMFGRDDHGKMRDHEEGEDRRRHPLGEKKRRAHRSPPLRESAPRIALRFKPAIA